MANIKSKLILDNAQFNKKAKVSQALVGGLGKGLKVLGGAAKFAAVSITAGAGAFALLVASTSSAIDRLGKVAKTTGFAAETLQKFQFAAEQSGVSSDQAAVALRRFSRRLGEAQKGTGELLPALKKLGINTRDASGNLKTGEEILFEFADGLANTENASERLALAFKAFDSEGAELVEVLKNGSDGLREFFSEAERLGFVLSADAIQGVERFRDELNKLTTVLGGVARQFVSALAPSLEDFTTQLTNNILKFIEAKGGAEAFGNFLKDKFIDIVVVAVKALGLFLNTLIKIANGIADLIRRFGDDPLFGIGDKASAAAKEILSLDQVLKDFTESLGLVETPGEALSFIEGLDAADPVLKKIIDRFRELEATQRGTVFGTPTPYAGFIVRDTIEQLRKELLEEVGAGIGEIDFTSFIEQLIGYKGEDVEEVGVRIGDDLQNGIVKSKQSTSFLVKLLDKIYGPEGQARVDEFLQAFFDDAEGMLDRVKAVAALVFGPDLVSKIKNAFQNSDVGDFTKTLTDGMVKAATMFEDALAQAFVNGKADFSDLADFIKITLAKAFIQARITAPLLDLFGLKTRASGGPVKAGQSYLVGEEGMEIFKPNTSGTIIPNNKINSADGSAMGGTTNVYYTINATDPESFKSQLSRDPEFVYNLTRVGARRTPG